MARKARGGFTVSGPDTDRNGYENGNVALSAAITFASHCRADEALNFYVRDPAGDAFGRVERADGIVLIYRTGAAK